MSTYTDGQSIDEARLAWIVSFGPVGGGSDGYLIRAEANARALATLGFAVSILEVSKRADSAVLWPNVEVHPAWPSVAPKPRFLGGLGLLGLLRVQLCLAAGLVRNLGKLRSAEVVVVEGGLLSMAFGLRLLSRTRPRAVVFDPVTVMSLLHRDREGTCTLQCKLRRAIWRVLEIFSVWSSDLTIAFGAEDAAHLDGGRVAFVPHAVLGGHPRENSHENPDVVGFLGGGAISPNRDAIEFIATSVLPYPGLESVQCKVIGGRDGYDLNIHKRIEFIGFVDDLPKALSSVSVCCAPMQNTGGPSTKVLDCLMHGKRTVCTGEAARGLALPPHGLWIAELSGFAEAVSGALNCDWPPEKARVLHQWMVDHHGLPALRRAWQNALASVGI